MIDYAKVINADDYTLGLSEHADVPQSDIGITISIGNYIEKNKINLPKVLDLGCGPDRISSLIADSIKKYNGLLVGLDISEDFINSAKKDNKNTNVNFICSDFLKTNIEENYYDVVFLQGFYHHILKNERNIFLKKIKKILKPNGLLLIGDEFTPEYKNEEERIEKVTGLYAYVIADAIQHDSEELAKIEAMNMVDDIASDTVGAGHSNNNLIKYIYEKSEKIYKIIFTKGILSKEYHDEIKEVSRYILKESAVISKIQIENHDRKDYKISISKQISDLEKEDFKVYEVKKYGPLDWVYGMGIVSALNIKK